MDCQRISDAEERKDEGNSERSNNNSRALRIAGETQNHSPVLCLECFRVARQMSAAYRGACRKGSFRRSADARAAPTLTGKISRKVHCTLEGFAPGRKEARE